MNIPCKTEAQARHRIDLARLGSRVDPTLEYLEELRNQVNDWLLTLNSEIANHYHYPDKYK